jgi:hypothetical protein
MWPSMQQVNRKRRREAATQRLLPFASWARMGTIGHEQPVDSGKADAQREGDRHVAARGRTVHDFQQRRAAPCRKVSASTDLLGRSHDQFVIVIVRV